MKYAIGKKIARAKQLIYLQWLIISIPEKLKEVAVGTADALVKSFSIP